MYYLRQMRLTDKPYDLDQSYKIVNLTVEWCKKFFTAPNIKRRKPLCLMIHNTPAREVYGEYCSGNNWLTINLHNCVSIKDIITTTIHEYVHFCQDLKDYGKMSKKMGYENNPYEVEARDNEKYYTNCWRSIKYKVSLTHRVS